MRILYAHTSTPSYVRCLKLLETLSKTGAKIVFFGAQRDNGPKCANVARDDGVVVRMFPRNLTHGIKSLPLLFLYLIQLRLSLQSFRPHIVILTNEELVAACTLLPAPPFVILDAIDALDVRWKSKGTLNVLSKIVTHCARSHANMILEVEDFRSQLRPDFINKTIVVRNSPKTQKNIEPIEESLKAKLPIQFIYASGSLNKNINGIETLIRAVKQIEDVALVIAGFVNDASLHRLFSQSVGKVIFLGPISHAQSLALANASVAVFAHYCPSIDNFRLAAPNKVYEAMALGRPLLINSETIISGMCEDIGFAYTSPYGDADALCLCIRKLMAAKNEGIDLNSVSERFDREFCWETQEAHLLSRLLKFAKEIKPVV